jgi:hypothetical protein
VCGGGSGGAGGHNNVGGGGSRGVMLVTYKVNVTRSGGVACSGIMGF